MSHKVLQTPELVIRIGWFIPLWRYSRFCPKDLISCITVCQLWRDVLTPLLWMVYDDSIFRNLNISNATIHANKQHIRYMNHNEMGPPTTALQVTRLKGLSLVLTYACRPEVLDLLVMNPALVSLEMTLRSSEKSGLVTITPALLKMTNLRCLSLFGNPYLEPDILRSILDSIQGLESLTLHIPTDTDLDFDDWRLYLGIKKLRFQFRPFRPTWLFCFLQHCPNVETLSITEDFRRDIGLSRPNVLLLSKILKQHCQKVKVVHYNECGISDALITPPTYCLSLIQATSNLVQLAMSMDDFPTVLCDALLHASAYSLEVLFLKCRGSVTTETFVSAGRILSSCPKLEHLQLVIQKYPECLEEIEKALTAQPWICSHLKTFALRSAFFQAQSFSCSAFCQHKAIKYACTIEMACEAEIQKQGWRNLDPRYEFRHVPPTRQKHRAVLLAAVSTLQHVNTVDLGYHRYEHAERPSKPFSFIIFSRPLSNASWYHVLAQPRK
ncbi:hypothetical protein BGZ94_010346 [Podila epigama]|nr:hypothetical protein BGZ94_010346 [Podila epigama]